MSGRSERTEVKLLFSEHLDCVLLVVYTHALHGRLPRHAGAMPDQLLALHGVSQKGNSS